MAAVTKHLQKKIQFATISIAEYTYEIWAVAGFMRETACQLHHSPCVPRCAQAVVCFSM